MRYEVRPMSRWRHYSGNIYTVLAIANTEGEDAEKRKKYPPTIVYVGKSGEIWARLLSDWHRSMTLIED